MDSIVWSIARGQHGVVSRGQLLAAGLTRAHIESRLRDRRLAALHRGVYLAGPVPPPLARAQAGLLACGEGAVLSHRSAAAIWKVWRYPDGAYPWVTVPHTRRLNRPRIVIRRASLEHSEVTKRSGLAITSPARTILDCAPLFSDLYEFESLVAEAIFLKLTSEEQLRRQSERSPRHGVASLRQVLGLPGGPRRTRSGGERWFLRLLRQNGFEGYEVNAKVFDREVDFLWPGLDFCVELDGWDAHRSRIAFERDRDKWAYLQASGIDVMPIAIRGAMKSEAETLDRLRKTLDRKRQPRP